VRATVQRLGAEFVAKPFRLDQVLFALRASLG
jgi:hypothetical protein